MTSRKTRDELLEELSRLRRRIAELEPDDDRGSVPPAFGDELELLYSTIENLSEGVSIVDAEERFVFINPAGESVFGVQPGRLVGRCLSEFVDTATFSRIQRQTHMRREGKQSSYELDIIRPDGETRRLSVSASPRIDPDGVFLGSIASFWDVTEQRRTEDRLDVSERNFLTLVDHMGVGVCLADENERIVLANPACARIFGVEPGGLEGRNLAEFVDATTLEKLERETVIRKSGASSTYEITVQGGDGVRRRARVTASPSFDSDGEFTGTIGNFTDVTEHAEMEFRLRESEERYRYLVEKAGIAILIDDLRGRFTFFNSRFAELFGFSAMEIRDRSIDDLVHPEDLAKVKSIHDARFRGEDAPSTYRFRGVRKDGGTVYLEIHVHAVVEDGKVTGSRSYIWDVSSSEILEQELRRHRDRLEEIVEERTEELRKANEKLWREVIERGKAENEARDLSRFPAENPSPVMRISRDGHLLHAKRTMGHLDPGNRLTYLCHRKTCQ